MICKYEGEWKSNDFFFRKFTNNYFGIIILIIME